MGRSRFTKMRCHYQSILNRVFNSIPSETFPPYYKGNYPCVNSDLRQIFQDKTFPVQANKQHVGASSQLEFLHLYLPVDDRKYKHMKYSLILCEICRDIACNQLKKQQSNQQNSINNFHNMTIMQSQLYNKRFENQRNRSIDMKFYTLMKLFKIKRIHARKTFDLIINARDDIVVSRFTKDGNIITNR